MTNDTRAFRLGIDLGGTKIEAIALDTGGVVIARERVPTPQGDYPATLTAIRDLIEAMEHRLGIFTQDPAAKIPLGVGIPGALSPHTGRVQNANSTVLIGEALDQDLSRVLQRPVRLANDANCFALSEAMDGAAADAEVVFGVIVGTGTGGGIVIRKQVLSGPNAIAGEWGHNPLPWPEVEELPGPPCYCGKQGCIETFLSGPGLAADHLRVAGESISAEALAQKALAGDASAHASLERYAQRMARALASVINVLDPDVIVLGGGLSNLDFLYTRVPELWGEWVFAPAVRTQLRPPKFGDSSGVRGAAWLWPLQESKQ
ncbi:MAG: ROK family protein [Gammaproteobacteria bacterium]